MFLNTVFNISNKCEGWDSSNVAERCQKYFLIFEHVQIPFVAFRINAKDGI